MFLTKFLILCKILSFSVSYITFNYFNNVQFHGDTRSDQKVPGLLLLFFFNLLIYFTAGSIQEILSDETS